MNIIYYRDVITILENLPFILTSEVRRREISYAQAAEEIGISKSNMYNLVDGTKSPTSKTIISILEWVMKRD